MKNRCGRCGSRNTEWGFASGRYCLDCGYEYLPKMEGRMLTWPEQWRTVRRTVRGSDMDVEEGPWRVIPEGCFMVAKEEAE